MAKIRLSNNDEHDQQDFNELLELVGSDKDRKAFSKIFEYFAPRVKSFLIGGGASDTIAEEIMQDTFVTIWEKAKSFDASKAAASTWIFTIARNKKIDQFRKIKRHEIDPNDPLFVQYNSTQVIEGDEKVRINEEQAILESAINELPEEQAKLLKYSFYEGKTHQEIADTYKIPLGTVKSRLRLALEKLKKKVKVLK